MPEKDPNEARWTIGQFSRMTMLSARMLRQPLAISASSMELAGGAPTGACARQISSPFSSNT